jgi:hypothetical protein
MIDKSIQELSRVVDRAMMVENGHTVCQSAFTERRANLRDWYLEG